MMRRLCALAAIVALGPSGARAAPPTGDQLLARAAALPGVRSYSVPVHFDVHVHRPIGMRVGVDGTAYYRAPASAALTITKAPAIIGGMFRGTYQLDVVPQAWPQKYHVTATAAAGGRETLTAVPREPGDVPGVTFTLGPDGAPAAAQWTYANGSTIGLSFVNARVGQFVLPASATIAVAMPTYHIEANATYGTYAFNEGVPDEVFSATR